MKNLTYLEQQLQINDYHYSFEINSDEEVVSLSLFDGEYDEFPSYSGNIFKILSHYSKLQEINIDISAHSIVDLQSVIELRQLKKISLESKTSISDIRYLTELPNLEFLYIESSDISDLSPLQHCQKLTSVFLTSAKISDVSVFRYLPNVTRIGLDYNQITDLSPLVTCAGLCYLSINFNQVQDISILKNFNKLTHFNANGNKIKDIAVLADLDNLLYLSINSNLIEDASPISNNRDLVSLSLQSNAVSNIAFIADLQKLQWLYLAKNPITDLGTLFDLKSLHHLTVSNAPFDGLQNFKSNLKYLVLDNCGIPDISFLDGQKDLEVLCLNNNKISNVDLLAGFPKLKNIYLANNDLNDVFPIHLFFELNELDLRGNQFGNLHFKVYPGYQYIHIDSTPEEQGTFDQLSELVGKHYFDIKSYNKALAYYYYDKTDDITADIYISKFIATPERETYLLKYYFSRVHDIMFRLKHDKESAVFNIHLERLKKRILSLQRIKPEYFFFYLTFDSLFRFNKNAEYEEYLQFSENPRVNPEMWYRYAGNGRVSRELLMRSLYYLQQLKQIKSPFYHRLYNDSKVCLKMRFAYTPEERAEHDKYLELLQNVENFDFGDDYKFDNATHSPRRPTDEPSTSVPIIPKPHSEIDFTLIFYIVVFAALLLKFLSFYVNF